MAAHRLACGLGLRVWKGSGGAHRTVVIAGALGVKQRFYENYAAHVSSEGLNAVTFDYVGVGASKPEGYEHATLDDWATNQDDVLGYASDEFDKPITLVGHSIGAQFLGTLARRDRVDRLLTISSMNNELRHQRQNGLALQAFWKVGVPALCSAFGRFPAKSLGLFEDVPSALAECHGSLFGSPGAGAEAHWKALAPHFALQQVRSGSVFRRVGRDDLFFVVAGEVDLVVNPAGAAAPAGSSRNMLGSFSAAMFRRASLGGRDRKVLRTMGPKEVCGVMELVKGVDQRRDSRVREREVYPTDVVVPRGGGDALLLSLPKLEFAAMRASENPVADFCERAEKACDTSTVDWMRRTSFLRGLSPKALAVLSQLATFRSVHGRKQIVAQGEPTRKFYIVLAGALDRLGGAGRTVRLKPGGGSGRGAASGFNFLRGTPKTASARAGLGSPSRGDDEGTSDFEADPEARDVGVLAAGDFFGELSLLERERDEGADAPQRARSSARAQRRDGAHARAVAPALLRRGPLPRRDPRLPVAAAEVQDAVKLRMTGQLQALDLPIFHDVEPDRLRHFTGTMEVRSFAPKTTLFAYGDAGDDFFILLQGEVTILDKGGAEIVTLKTKGDYFGELALARAEPRSATVIAASPAVCACVDGARFRDIFLESPAARAEFEIKAMREKASAGAVLSHPVTRDPFRKFLDSELASENHECWDAIADYRRRVAASEGEVTDADEANAMARTLYDAFIAPGCDTQVNVSSKMAGKLRAKIYDESAGDAALFDGVAAEIDRMLRGNMMRFAAKAESGATKRRAAAAAPPPAPSSSPPPPAPDADVEVVTVVEVRSPSDDGGDADTAACLPDKAPPEISSIDSTVAFCRGLSLAFLREFAADQGFQPNTPTMAARDRGGTKLPLADELGDGARTRDGDRAAGAASLYVSHAHGAPFRGLLDALEAYLDDEGYGVDDVLLDRRL
ncbi:hypothetical protein JL722_4269 [Aureococcus anophagefferens]|nr:hypothetical protein JL722_4269 [Aureococcus anophagefferens]